MITKIRLERGSVRTTVISIIIVVIVAIALVGVAIKWIFDSTEKMLVRFIEGIKTGEETTTFISYVTEINGTTRLQVATLKAQETFIKVESLSYLWDLFSFSATVTIMAPVEYTFYLDLNEGWHFLVQDTESENSPLLEVVAVAPQIHFNTPAINVSEWQILENEKSIIINEKELQEKLRKELVTICNTMADQKIETIRPIARQEIEKFVQDWFVNNRFTNSEIQPQVVAVYFEDEPLPPIIGTQLRELNSGANDN